MLGDWKRKIGSTYRWKKLARHARKPAPVESSPLRQAALASGQPTLIVTEQRRCQEGGFRPTFNERISNNHNQGPFVKSWILVNQGFQFANIKRNDRTRFPLCEKDPLLGISDFALEYSQGNLVIRDRGHRARQLTRLIKNFSQKIETLLPRGGGAEIWCWTCSQDAGKLHHSTL